MLNAGIGYTQYAWNTGASTQQISANTLGGMRWVYRQERLQRHDSMRLKILQPPLVISPCRVTICSYETPRCRSLNSFRELSMEHVNILLALRQLPLASMAGSKGSFGCTGRDSMQVVVNPDCIKGIYVPNVLLRMMMQEWFFKPRFMVACLNIRLPVSTVWSHRFFNQESNTGLGWKSKKRWNRGQCFCKDINYQLETEARRQLKGSVILCGRRRISSQKIQYNCGRRPLHKMLYW